MRIQFIALMFVLLVPLGKAQEWKPAGDKIMTPWGEELNPGNVWQEYPRPQLMREDWMNLNRRITRGRSWSLSVWNRLFPVLEKTLCLKRGYGTEGNLLCPGIVPQ